MNQTKFFLLLSLIIVSGLFSSCKKEDSNKGNLIISARMSRSGINPKQTTPMLVFNTGYVVVREVVFDGEMTNGSSISITEEKITTIDLVTGVANPPFLMDIPAGTYTDINLGIEIQDETSRPSVIAEGVYTNASGVATPKRFEFNSGEVFEANSVGTVTLSAATPATAKITFDPHEWFSVLTRAQLDNATRTNGVIIISETRNSALFTLVADRLDDATQAYFE